MKKWIIAFVVVALLAAGLAVTLSNFGANNQPSSQKSPADTSEKAPANTIYIYDNEFRPAILAIKKGTAVVFVNKGSDDHWPASNDHPTHELYSQFDPKKPINPGASWSFTFDKPGEWKFHDHLFPNITGTITVEP